MWLQFVKTQLEKNRSKPQIGRGVVATRARTPRLELELPILILATVRNILQSSTQTRITRAGFHVRVNLYTI